MGGLVNVHVPCVPCGWEGRQEQGGGDLGGISAHPADDTRVRVRMFSGSVYGTGVTDISLGIWCEHVCDSLGSWTHVGMCLCVFLLESNLKKRNRTAGPTYVRIATSTCLGLWLRSRQALAV